MTFVDYAIIAFYFLFLLALGLVFRRLSRDTSDYFRCGGAMPWWITGTSAWIASFSAWTFTGAAGKVYQTGTLVLVLYWSSLLPLAIILLYTARRFRRLRVVTWMEAVRQRYGRGTEQFYTWIKLPLLLIFSGVGLNAIGVFMSSVFHVPMTPTLIVLGAVVTVVALVGGAWAVLASDFVQMLLVVSITVVTAFLALRQPAIGSVSNLLARLPHEHFHWTDLARPQFVFFWVLALSWIKLLEANGYENATMYLMVKNDRDARRMVLIPLLGTLVGPLIWFIPPMVARLTHPNLAAEYSQLVKGTEGEAAFVAVALDVMPRGLIALLICAMFGATLTSMDAAMNKGVGVFVRSFYLPVLRRRSSETHLLIVGKVCTGVFGVIIIVMSLLVNRYRQSGLFDLMNQLAASLAFPLMIPLAYGLFFARTPGWSGWSTALVGLLSSLLVKYAIDPQWVMSFFGVTGPLSVREQTDFLLFATIFANTVACSAWYAASALLWRRAPASDRARIATLFANLATPIEPRLEQIADYDAVLYSLIGRLCLVYGGFVLLLLLIPNPPIGRLCFLFCALLIAGTGAVLHAISRRKAPAAGVTRRAKAIAA